MPPQLTVFLLAAAPISEVRGAIPWGILVEGMSPIETLFWALAGNLLAYLVALLLVFRLGTWLQSRAFPFHDFFAWFFSRTQRHHEHQFHRLEAWALFLLVALPLPLTGVWTGAAAAFVFGIPFIKALRMGSIGACVAAVLMLVLSVGLLKLPFLSIG